MLDDFIARKHGRQRISYPHESLKEILKETYGVIVYQEQVMQIAQVLADFTLGAADLLRRAMGKKKADVMAAQRIEFRKGAAPKGVSESLADEIFDLMEKFAEYGFNKSHSAAYALLTYQTAYLKAHHKTEFMAAVLTNDRDNADKVAKGIRSARKSGVEVMAPCINRSALYFDSVDGKLLFGMGGIKGVGGNAVEAIIDARQADGPFTSLFNFCERIDLKKINRKTIEALIKAGALDCLGEPRARLIAATGAALERAQHQQRDREAGQSNLFAMLSTPDDTSSDELPKEFLAIEEWAEQELLAHEKSALGFYISGHPLDRFAHLISKYSTATVDALPKADNYSVVTLAGVQNAIRVVPFKSRKGRMAIIDKNLTGSTEVIAMGETLTGTKNCSRLTNLCSSEVAFALTETKTDEDPIRLGVGRNRRSTHRG